MAYSVRFGGDWRIESKLKSYAKIDGLAANLSPRPRWWLTLEVRHAPHKPRSAL